MRSKIGDLSVKKIVWVGGRGAVQPLIRTEPWLEFVVPKAGPNTGGRGTGAGVTPALVRSSFSSINAAGVVEPHSLTRSLGNNSSMPPSTGGLVWRFHPVGICA